MKEELTKAGLYAFICCVIFFLLSYAAQGQSVAVNSNGAAAHSTAMLDVSSQSKGLLIPRMTTIQRSNIANPATSLMVYDTDLNGYMYYDGTAWVSISTGVAPGTEWKLSGNTGANPSLSFLGTLDGFPLTFRVSNQKSGRIDLVGNTTLGFKAANGLADGTHNVAIGGHALFTNTIGDYFVAIGDSALYYSNNPNSLNTAVGAKALLSNTIGLHNVAMGYKSLYSNTVGTFNSAFGTNSLVANTSGGSNSAFGLSALAANQVGNNNSGYGFSALFKNVSGSNNAAFGSGALQNNLESGNSAFGTNAMLANQTGINNCAFGTGAIYYGSGSYNSAFGHSALYNNYTGKGNVAVGNASLNQSSGANYSVAVGDSALFNNSVSNLTAAGTRAMFNNDDGARNSAFGYEAIRANIGGSANSAFGFQALTANTGSSNCAFGAHALSGNGAGNNNVAIGEAAMGYSSAGSRNTAIGSSALFYNTSGWDNHAIGNLALQGNLSGFGNIAIGAQALKITSEENGNIAIGHYALDDIDAGSYNICIGAHSTLSGIGLDNAIAIGTRAVCNQSNSMVLGSINGLNGASASTRVGIGTPLPQVAFHVMGGSDASYVDNSGNIVSGNTDGSNIVIDDNEILARNDGVASNLFLQASGGNVKIGSTSAPTYLLELATNSAGKPGSNAWTIVSDARLKKDVSSFQDGLAVINQINPVWFKYNGEAGIKDTSRFVGILAQDIQKIAPYMVSEKTMADEQGKQSNYLNYDGNAMTYILINAIKEQQKMIESLKKQNEEILKRL